MDKVIQAALLRNRKTFLKYNGFRKKIFQELSPRDSEVILFMLPWMLSVNHPAVPGYLSSLKEKFWVHGIDHDREIRIKEKTFKRRLGIKRQSTLLKYSVKSILIQGVYTIGSVGTINQTAGSDCDIWICYDKRDYRKKDWDLLSRKIYLIKDWLDLNLKIPVFFFITELSDICNSMFGCVDRESSGSAQRNFLKEEFYRTTILISGKIPLWWVCWDRNESFSYQQAADLLTDEEGVNNDLVDMGDLQPVESDEYFGAALWQLHKALTQPLKSLVKMFFLRMLLDTQGRGMAGIRFRAQVFKNRKETFPDPGAFLIREILRYNQLIRKGAEIEFLKACFYLRCRIKPYERNDSIKKILSKDLFEEYSLEIREKIRLSRYDQWSFEEQIKLGNRLYRLFLKLYREIEKGYTEKTYRIDPRDLTILGRKISVYFSQKKNKIPILRKPDQRINIRSLKLNLAGSRWTIAGEGKQPLIIVEHPLLIHTIAYIAWNNLYAATHLSMVPNDSPVSIQEIINLANKIQEIFGSHDTVVNDLTDFLQEESIRKILVVISFEKSPWEKDSNDFHAIYQNSWGELFVRHLNSSQALQRFLRQHRIDPQYTEVRYYLQRNATYYEKIIERTRRLLVSLP